MPLYVVRVPPKITRQPLNASPGSVRARVDMEFPSNLSDPLKPLRDAMQDGKLGMFVVDPQLEINPRYHECSLPAYSMRQKFNFYARNT
ncbi:hypothetical protein P5673_011418 [Acropora cervicornis]|uniref:Uncharacterized protein n=1 Tax=Acropora cervicornis TaxID=6130 RepID=A0AAD9V817_ACRCE|nr:hypothetical protein P5673_011418 [Acropora cervicornis]